MFKWKYCRRNEMHFFVLFFESNVIVYYILFPKFAEVIQAKNLQDNLVVFFSSFPFELCIDVFTRVDFRKINFGI